jgi:hypothetical protein
MIAIETLGKAIPYGGTVATIISGILALQVVFPNPLFNFLFNLI